jgi:uncharacterized membrane protein
MINTMTNSPFTTGSTKLRVGLLISYLCLFGLFTIYTTNALLNGKLLSVVFIMPCLTLVIFLPGLWQHRHRTYNWLCFVILLHFTVAVTNVMSPSGDLSDILQLTFSSILFVTAMMSSRWLQYWHLENNN